MSGRRCTFCTRLASYRQREGLRLHLCDRHARRSAAPVDRLANPREFQKQTIHVADELHARLTAWCAGRALTVREVTDYIVRRALDAAGASNG